MRTGAKRRARRAAELELELAELLALVELERLHRAALELARLESSNA